MSLLTFLRFRHRRNNWNYIFLNTDSLLSDEARLSLATSAIDMYLDKKTAKKLKSEEYEGRMRATRKYYVLGSFGGYEFTANIETNHGKRELSFLVAKEINQALN